MGREKRYQRVAREDYKASFMASFNWLAAFRLFAEHAPPPLQFWIKWVGISIKAQVYASSDVDHDRTARKSGTC